MTGQAAISHDELLALYRCMIMGRELSDVFSDSHPGWHSIKGEEGVIVGSFFGLRPTDTIAPHYRGPELASYIRGVPLREILAAILSKATGCSRGRHTNEVCGPFEYNIIGNYSGALGSTLSYAAGAALAAKLKQTDDVAVVTFGDGTAGRGEFHEAIGLASMLKLPVVFICQNNQYAITKSASEHLAGASVADRAIGYNIPGTQVDGMDVLAVRSTVQAAVSRARNGDGPSLIEALAYRLAGHFAADKAAYRSASETRRWMKKDPVLNFERKLLSEKILSHEEAVTIREHVALDVKNAKTQALQDPEPGADDLGLDEVYAASA